MKKSALALPEIGLIAATRALLGAGIGLLVADHMDVDKRRLVGAILVAIGVVSTVPLVIDVASKLRD